jgi:hypothetical protein
MQRSLSIPDAKCKHAAVSGRGIQVKEMRRACRCFLPGRAVWTSADAEKYMRADCRNIGWNIGAFRSNQLKESNDLPHNRFRDLESAESMARLERLSDVRPAIVARGKALIANPHYPDREVIRQVSELLAGKLKP